METREYKVYSFNELTEEQKDKVLERYRDWNVKGDYWWDYMPEHITEDIKPHGLRYISFSFSGFCHQGQGASVEYSVDDTFVFAKHLLTSQNKPEYYAKELKTLRRVQKWCPDMLQTSGTTDKWRGYSHYQQYHSIDFTIDSPRTFTFSSPLMILQDTLNELSKDYHQDLEHETYKSLEKEYEYQTSDDTLSEYFAESDYMFTADGKID